MTECIKAIVLIKGKKFNLCYKNSEEFENNKDSKFLSVIRPRNAIDLDFRMAREN